MNNQNCNSYYDTVYMTDIHDLKKKFSSFDIKPFNF